MTYAVAFFSEKMFSCFLEELLRGSSGSCLNPVERKVLELRIGLLLCGRVASCDIT